MRILAALAVVACKETAAPPPPSPLPPAEILQRTFAGDGAFVASELTFSGVKPDGTYDSLIVRTQRRPTGGPFDPNSLYNCPTTIWRGGVATVDPKGSCAVGFERPLTPPRCTLAELWARAIEEGAKPGMATIVLVHAPTPVHPGATWKLEAGRRFEYDDDCAPNVEAGGTFAKRLPAKVAAPAHVDELTRAATAWLAETQPDQVVGSIRAVNVGPDGRLAADGAYRMAPAAVWPDGKPQLDTSHYGGAAPFGVCRALLWTAARGWHLEELVYACADVDAPPRCPAAAVLARAGTGGDIAFEDGTWRVAARRFRESELDCTPHE